MVVSGAFNDGDEITLPVTKWAARKLVAKHFRESAKHAYLSPGFQSRVHSAARLVFEDRVAEAVNLLKPFLKDKEEFLLLTMSETKQLVENALAAKACFNQKLCDNTARLFYHTNLRLNRDTILKEWRKIATVSEQATLLENVDILERSQNFEAAYDRFLEMIFEAISNRKITAEALATTLMVLRDKTPKIKESHEMASKLNDLIGRLKNTSPDDAAIYEAEDLIATIQEELAAANTLGNFDNLPGDTNDDMNLSGDAAGAGGGTPVININSPLIQIGGSSGAGEAPPDGGAPPVGDEELGEGGDDELEQLLGGPGGGQQPQQPAPAPQPGAPGQMPMATSSPSGQMESRRAGKALNEEWEKPWLKKDKDEDGDDDGEKSEKKGKPFGDDDEDCDDGACESFDPYAMTDNVKFNESLNLNDYGTKVITDTAELAKVVSIMQRLAAEHKLAGSALVENLENLAKASLKAAGLRIPAHRLTDAIEEATAMFAETECDDDSVPPWKKGDDDSVEDEDVVEDQFKGPRIPPRGLKKSSINPLHLKKESIEWSDSQEDGVLGEYAGVRFILDHGGSQELEPVILSEDGTVVIPIPAKVRNSALASAGIVEGDGRPFIKWLDASIEQIRPVSDMESEAIEEAVVRIQTDAAGSMAVEIVGEVDVQETPEGEGGVPGEEGMVDPEGEMGGAEEVPGEEMPGEEGMPGDDMGAGGEDDFGGMAPVDAVEPGAGGPEEPGADDMPDFEGGAGGPDAGPEADTGAPDAGPPAGGPPKPPTDDFVEDKEITHPPNSKYTSFVTGDKREVPKAKLSTFSKNKVDGIGPEVKSDDGKGTSSPTAGSHGD